MKRRIISLLLVLSMMISMMPTIALTANAIEEHNPYHKDGNLCYMLPYAYNARQWASADYYIAHYNIKHVYNYDYLSRSFEQGIPQAIDTALRDPASTITAVINEVINFDGEITEQDLYDYMLSYMLVENATTPDPYQTESIQDVFSAEGVLADLFDAVKASGTLTDAGKQIDKLKSTYPNAWSKLFGNWNMDYVGDFLLVMNAVCASVDEYNQFKTLTEDYYTVFAKLGGNEAAEIALTQMWNNTDDPMLKISIEKFLTLVESDDYGNYLSTKMMESIYASQEMAMNVASSTFRATLTQGLLELTKNTVASSFVYGLLIGYGTADLIFAIGDFQESVFEITLYDTIDSSVLGAVNDLETICNNHEGQKISTVYSEAYVFAMQMAWRLKVKELEKCKDFLERGKQKFWFRDNSTIEDTVERIESNIKRVDTEIPSRFINNALDQYSRDLDLIYAGYKITYNLDGGTGDIPLNETKKYNEPYTIPNTTPIKDGYTFALWQLGEDSYYSPGMELEASFNPCWCSRELVFTAKWVQQNSIIYDANGGTDAPVAEENTLGTNLLSEQIPQRTGYTFVGWSEDPEATTADYLAGGELDKDGAVVLYAVWAKAVFDVVFHANGGTFPNGSESVTLKKTYLENLTLDPGIPTRAGYTFAEKWSLNADGTGTTYPHGKPCNDIGGADADTKHLYAVWEEADIIDSGMCGDSTS